jgi:LAS seventeen-binding protein 1/2
MVDALAPLVHIIAQTRQNIAFLVSQNQITETDAQDILAKLPSAPTQNPILTPPHPSRANSLSQNSTSTQPSVKARALWGYNVEGRVRCVGLQNTRLSDSQYHFIRRCKIFLSEQGT